MASKKQQKRHDKAVRHGLGRHAFEYVTVDEEGNEIEDEEKPEKPARGTAARGSKGSSAGRARRPPKTPQPPSLKRLGKRGALFLPVILLLTLSQKHVSIGARVMQAVLFAVVFVAIMWFSDHLIYKMWVKRQAKEKAAGRPGSSGKG